MFEKAIRLKVRFNFKGLCSVEDLWDLTVQELDSIYQELSKEYESQQGVSLLVNTSNASRLTKLKMDLVKHIVEVKLQEAVDKEQRAAKKAKKQQLLEIIEQKQNAEFVDMSLEELQQLVDNM